MADVQFSMEISKPVKRIGMLAGFSTFIVPCYMLLLGVLGGNFEEFWRMLLPIGFWLLIFALVFPQSYTLRADDLVIRCGLRRTLVRYRDVAVVRLLTKGDSAYTVEIKTRDNDSFLIAPRDRERFLSEMKKRAPLHSKTSDFEEELAELASEDDERLLS